MRRPLRRDEMRLWSMVLADVRPRPGRARPALADDPAPPPASKAAKPTAPASVKPAPPKAKHALGPQAIEPNRARRIVLGREPIGGRLDLHGMNQDQARAALERFILRAVDEGERAVLVITGKGLGGDGVLKRRVPEWLSSAPLRPLIAGVSDARHRHGGKGALYVALKRRPPSP